MWEERADIRVMTIKRKSVGRTWRTTAERAEVDTSDICVKTESRSQQWLFCTDFAFKHRNTSKNSSNDGGDAFRKFGNLRYLHPMKYNGLKA